MLQRNRVCHFYCIKKCASLLATCIWCTYSVKRTLLILIYFTHSVILVFFYYFKYGFYHRMPLLNDPIWRSDFSLALVDVFLLTLVAYRPLVIQKYIKPCWGKVRPSNWVMQKSYIPFFSQFPFIISTIALIF